MVAMTPLITIQILGLMYQMKLRKTEVPVVDEAPVAVETPVEVIETTVDIFDNEIFELEDGDE